MTTKTILKKFSNFNKEYFENANKFSIQIEKHINKTIIKAKTELLKELCNDYEFEYKELYKKYVTPYKKKQKERIKYDTIDTISDTEDEEIKKNLKKQKPEVVLERVEIDDKICYIDNQEGGRILNQKAEKIGEIKNGKYLIYS